MNFLKKDNKRDLIGIDLNDEYLKIAHVRHAALKIEVANLISREVRGMSDEDIAAFITQTLADLKIVNPRAFIAVPLHTVITRSIEIPSRDPEEIREIVNLQASRHTPYSRSEIIVDTLLVGIVRESYTKALLVIAPREIVVRQTKILEKANLNLEKVFFPPEGLCHAVTKIMDNETSAHVTAIVHMDTVFTNFVVIQKGKILFVRGISIGASHLLEEKEVYHERFTDELHKSLESYIADEAGPQPSLLLLTGVIAEITDLDDLFSQTLSIPIKHQTYYNHFPITKQARAAASSSKQVSYFNLIAPLLLFEKMKVNLVSEEQKLRIRLEERGKEMVKTGMFVMILLSLAIALFVSKVYFKTAYLQNLTARYQSVKESAKELERISTKTQVIKQYLSTRGNSIEALAALYDTLPTDVRLSSVKYEDGQKLSVKGTSAVMGSVFSFVTNLEKSKQFKSVKTKYVTSGNDGGKVVQDFEINALIGGREAE